MTNQRQEILDYISQSTVHPTAEEIYDIVKQKLTRISKATVYNNLNFLVENNIIKMVNIKGVSRFEMKMEPHHHLICQKCSKIEDFESEDLNNYAIKLIKNESKFEIQEVSTNFLGLCDSCKDT
jgi:Fur family ferric uptake transcriptional regulator